MREDKNAEAPLLKVEHLNMFFPVSKGMFGGKAVEVKAVNDVSFSVQKGQTFGLVGESGCGKTTTGKCVLRIYQPTDGTIEYRGRDISRASKRNLRCIRREIQLIFQDPYGSLDPRQSVFSIVKEAVVSDKKPWSATDTRDRVNELLSLVELDPAMGDRYPHELSGGQRQRLGIARALACNPELIVCDEPVSALDVSIQAQIINLFADLQRKLGLTYLFIAHDLAVVRHIADVIAVMYLGRIVEVLTPDELYTNPMHPYTKALISAVPTTDYYEEKKRSRTILKGEVPSPMNAPSGCPFHPRCPLAGEDCRKAMPELGEVGQGHRVACYHVGEGPSTQENPS